MKIGITAVLAAAALAAAAGAQAQENTQGAYVGAGVGSFNLDIDNPGDIGQAFDRYSSDDTAWKAFVGYRVNPYLSFEAAYVNLGSPDDIIAPDTKLTVETDGFAPYVVGTLPIGDSFEAFAKAGYYWYDVNTRLTQPGNVIASDTRSDSTFVWSAGLGLNVFERVNLRLEYEQFDFNSANTSNALWLTGGWRF
jgi:opacity protein-like surface antigen